MKFPRMKKKYLFKWKGLNLSLDFSKWFFEKEPWRDYLINRLIEFSNLLYRALGFLFGVLFTTDMLARGPFYPLFLAILVLWLTFDVRFSRKKKEAS